ncbi:MAG TPA: hypothetical protein VKS44_07720 [Candidatus Acidoferrales bacterium]|nr:hypothetical protein [Candidatus Acidoferrales bacterium]
MKLLKRFRQDVDARMWIRAAVIACLMTAEAYKFRALLAAELLFGMAFLVVVLLGAVFYFAGDVAERGLALTEAGLHAVAPRVRRTYRELEEIARKWSENARAVHAHK